MGLKGGRGERGLVGLLLLLALSFSSSRLPVDSTPATTKYSTSLSRISPCDWSAHICSSVANMAPPPARLLQLSLLRSPNYFLNLPYGRIIREKRLLLFFFFFLLLYHLWYFLTIVPYDFAVSFICMSWPHSGEAHMETQLPVSAAMLAFWTLICMIIFGCCLATKF